MFPATAQNSLCMHRICHNYIFETLLVNDVPLLSNSSCIFDIFRAQTSADSSCMRRAMHTTHMQMERNLIH